MKELSLLSASNVVDISGAIIEVKLAIMENVYADHVMEEGQQACATWSGNHEEIYWRSQTKSKCATV